MLGVREIEFKLDVLDYIPEDGEYHKFVDRIVKANGEIFVLHVLANKPMCGYDVIKEIFLSCSVLLSQGNVYPILHSLEEKGILHAEFTKSNMRSKLYFIVPEQRETIQKKVDLFVKAMDDLAHMIATKT
jgi:DNA-binding PadR family transcriptional regulator